MCIFRANTVYGLGFSSESELNKFIEKFSEVKEATRAGKVDEQVNWHNHIPNLQIINGD